MIRNHVSLPKPVHVKYAFSDMNSFYYVDAVDVPRFFTNLRTKYKQPLERFIERFTKVINALKPEIPIVIRVATSQENKIIVDIGYVALPNIHYYIERYGYFETPISSIKFKSSTLEVNYD